MYAVDTMSTFDGSGGNGNDIDLDFDAAINIASQMQAEANSLNGELNKIVSAVDELTASWSSTTATKVKNVCDSFTSTFTNFYNLINSTPEKIEYAANALKSAEGDIQ